MIQAQAIYVACIGLEYREGMCRLQFSVCVVIEGHVAHVSTCCTHEGH